MVCGTGFGDQYACIMSAYQAYIDYKKMNYDVSVYWWVQNKYFPSDLSLDTIYDLSQFGTEIGQIYYKDFDEFVKGYTKLPTRGVIMTYVDNITDELLNYEHIYYDRVCLQRLNGIPNEKHFLRDEILEIADNISGNVNDFNAVHFRVNDVFLFSTFEEILKDPIISEKIKGFDDLISKSKDEKFMICSNNKSINDYFLNKFDNTFCNKFTYEIPMYNSIVDELDPQSSLQHSKEILAEMTLFRKAKTIYQINTSHSNFLLYGIYHNIHYENFKDKVNHLVRGI